MNHGGFVCLFYLVLYVLYVFYIFCSFSFVLHKRFLLCHLEYMAVMLNGANSELEPSQGYFRTFFAREDADQGIRTALYRFYMQNNWRVWMMPCSRCRFWVSGSDTNELWLLRFCVCAVLYGAGRVCEWTSGETMVVDVIWLVVERIDI